MRRAGLSASAELLVTRATLRGNTVLATAMWLAGWLDVTRRYCINTAKPILKLFRPSGSPIILVSSDPCADTQFQGHQRGVKYTGWEKLPIFDGNRRYEIGR